MATKTYKIDFFQGQVGADGQGGTVSRILARLARNRGCPVVGIGGMQHEVRNLVSHNNGAVFEGVFAKFREDDIPHAGAPGGRERELDLDADEGLIEKNHFLYYRKNQLLVYQRNGNGSTSYRFASYLTEIEQETIVFNPVLQPDPARRLMRGEVMVRSVEMTFARPTNRALYPDDQWTRHMFEALGGAGGVRMHTKVTSDARSRDPGSRYLDQRVKRALTELVDSGLATTAKLNVEEEGVIHPIDLLTDRLFAEQTVEMDGRYPIPESMYNALHTARQEKRAELHRIFGEGQDALV